MGGQAMRKKLPPPENTLSQQQAAPNQAASAQDFLAPEDYVAQDEIFKVTPACGLQISPPYDGILLHAALLCREDIVDLTGGHSSIFLQHCKCPDCYLIRHLGPIVWQHNGHNGETMVEHCLSLQ